jgi:hypothetical protein
VGQNGIGNSLALIVLAVFEYGNAFIIFKMPNESLT